MPIVTQGHQVQVMPTYTPLDPRSVVFNPGVIADGALSSIQIAQALAQQKAFAQAQAELAATREGRLGAMNAQNLAAIQLAPEKNIADIALARQQAAVAPSQTDVALAGNKDQLANLALKESLRGFTDDTARTKAQVENAIAPLAGDAAIRNLNNDAETAPKEHQLKLAKLSQDIESIVSDKNLSDAQKLATIRHLNAQSNALDAAARKDDRYQPKQEDVLKQLADVTQQILRLENGKVVGSVDGEQTTMPQIQYQSATMNPDGTPITKVPDSLLGFIPWGTKDAPPRNPEADRRANELKGLYELRNQLTQLATGAGQQQGAPAQAAGRLTPAEAKKLPKGTKFIGTDGVERIVQ